MIRKKLKKQYLELFLDNLRGSYRVIGPKIENNVIILAEISFRDIPAGYEERQKAGSYKLNRGDRPELFTFSVGPDSFKRFLHPPSRELFSFKKSKSGMAVTHLLKNEKPLAFIGIRACDLSALRLYDRIFLEGPVKDPSYSSLREKSLIVALNCLLPGDNCFCSSMGTGPEVKDWFDIALTELDGYFFLEAATLSGQEALAGLPLQDVDVNDIDEKAARIQSCSSMIKKSLRVDDLPGLIHRNLEHQNWTDIAERDLECGNCTQVCPTCFCNASYDVVHLSGLSRKPPEIAGVRIRKWDSCFSRNFARVHGGNFRPSRKARYRQWMSHKLAFTMEQFEMPGCVGCGRCITWCPAGIDITRELEALRNVR